MNAHRKYPLLVPSILAFLALTAATHEASAQRQRAPLVTLKSPESILGQSSSKAAITASPSRDDNRLYALREDTGEMIVHEQDARGRAHPVRLGQRFGPTAVDVAGNVYSFDSEARLLRVLGQTGAHVRSFPVPPPDSLGVLSDGNVVIASPARGKLLHLYSPKGRWLRSFGEMRPLDDANEAQSRFLNGGRVAVGPSDVIYFVPRYAPSPVVQKFSANGRLLSEFAVQGEAVEIQSGASRRYLDVKEPDAVGGLIVVQSAAVDPTTGHLWVCMNGSSKTGVVYEYDADGTKLGEYAFVTDFAPGAPTPITGVKGIVVKSPVIYVLTTEGVVHRFSLTDRLALTPARSRPASYGRRTWGLSANWAPAPLLPQGFAGCPAAEAWSDCGKTCLSGSSPSFVNCKAALEGSLGTGLRIIGSTCRQVLIGQDPMFPNGGCQATVTTCDEFNNRVTHSTEQKCNAPPPRAELRANSNCNNSYDDDWDSDVDYDDVGCLTSPIIIDIAGNGFRLTGLSDPTLFDFDANGLPLTMGWTGRGEDDAFLVLDRNGDGEITTGQELFGNNTPLPDGSLAANGFAALAADDANGDGYIDHADGVYRQLRVWQDVNHNGVSEGGELRSLPSVGVTRISLDYKESRRQDGDGNTFRYRSKVTSADGRERYTYDVFLVFDH